MEAVILAAGRGSRMKEAIPKVLIDVEGKPMIKRIVESLNNSYNRDTVHCIRPCLGCTCDDE